jgi:hypothetical protein
MRKFFIGLGVGFGLIAAYVTTLGLINQPQSEGVLTVQQIETIALNYAQQMALQGTPTSTASKKMSVAEFRQRLDPCSKGDLGTDEVWLVVFKGIIIVRHPSQQTTTSETTADTMWINLTSDGRIIGWGTLAPGAVLDLNRPVPTQLTSQITPTANAPVTKYAPLVDPLSNRFKNNTAPVGIPAIVPKMASADRTTPAFSKDEVKSYVEAHAGGLRSSVNPETTPAVTKIEFIMNREVSARLNGADIPLPDDALLCYVEISGSFTTSGQPGTAPTTSNRIVQVFDAITGNLLLTVS